ncbi:unnamed protein product [Lymnaea stagnalis]|uniref:Alpha-and gamma-adaptin-binding protein p34 n=1 Tax=Lymnaea stagnalis TaxID=6523 RepID=A0AAV2I1Q8_LYMST
MALPIALFSSSSGDFRPQDFVKTILQVSELPKPKTISEDIKSYDWHFETKYYSTTVELCTTENRTIGNQEFAESVEAFIHYFDPNLPSSFEQTQAWLPYLKHIEPDVLLLVCKTSKHSDAICRRVTQEWCIQNGFELVELQPEINPEDEEDDFPETTGMARVIQALHAHTWPNLSMKSSPTIQSPYLRQMMKEQHLANQQLTAATFDSSCINTTCQLSPTILSKETPHEDTNYSETGHAVNKVNNSLNGCDVDLNDSGATSCKPEEDILKIDEIDWKTLLGKDAKIDEDMPLTDNDVGVEEFEQLFMKLKVMKDRAENLPAEERKKYAEKVAISFWKAIGGDEDEIEGLGDSD